MHENYKYRQATWHSEVVTQLTAASSSCRCEGTEHSRRMAGAVREGSCGAKSHSTTDTIDTTDAIDDTDGACSTFFVVWPTSTRFDIHSGNM
jgi:hypothetical protein